MKIIIYLSFIVLYFGTSDIFGQDFIATKSGRLFNGNIISIDSSSIVFDFQKNGELVRTRCIIESVDSFKIFNQVFYMKDIAKSELIDFKKKIKAKLIGNEPTYALADSLNKLHKSYVYLYSGKIIFGDLIDYKKPILGFPYVKLDGVEYPLNDIKFMQYYRDFYANSKDLNPMRNSAMSLRISKGKINLYQREIIYYSYNQPNYSSIFNYYNKGLGELQKANYKNLLFDLSDNPESMVHLNKFNSTRITQNVLYIGGLSLIAIGFATLVNKTKDYDGKDESKAPNVTANIATACLGGFAFLGGYMVSLSKPKHLKNAIDAYNQE